METTNQKKGHIILLNGTSSSGKSTMAKEIIKELPEYFHLSVDEYAYFIDLMEKRDDKRLIPVETYHYFHRNIAMFSDSGVSVVVDTLFDCEASREDFFDVLKGYPVLKVGLYCSEEVLAIREQERGDRCIGNAKGQINIVHKNMSYDLSIDTHQDDKLINAKKIINLI